MGSWLKPWSWGKGPQDVTGLKASGDSLGSSRTSLSSSQLIEAERLSFSEENTYFKHSMMEFIRLKKEYFERHIHARRFDHKVIELPTSWLVLEPKDPWEIAYNSQINLFQQAFQKADEAFKKRQEEIEHGLQKEWDGRIKRGWKPDNKQIKERLDRLKESLEKVLDTYLENHYEQLQRFSYEILAMRCRKLAAESQKPLCRKIDTTVESVIWNHLLIASENLDLIEEKIDLIFQNLQGQGSLKRSPNLAEHLI